MGTYSLIVAALLGIYVGATLCALYNVRKREGVYQKGFEAAKEIYYTTPMAIKRKEEKEAREREQQEQERMFKAIGEENKAKVVPSDLLLAYGVSKVKHLPKSVLDTWNVSQEDLEKDLDTLLNDEVSKYVNE